MLEKKDRYTVVMWDERLTTAAAERTLMEAGVRREHRKEHLDSIAAGFYFTGIS